MFLVSGPTMVSIKLLPFILLLKIMEEIIDISNILPLLLPHNEHFSHMLLKSALQKSAKPVCWERGAGQIKYVFAKS